MLDTQRNAMITAPVDLNNNVTTTKECNIERRGWY